MKRTALTVAGIAFGLIALLHLARVYFQFPIIIGTTFIPISANVIAFLVTAALSFWMFYSLKK